jgi:hypothetical protein
MQLLVKCVRLKKHIHPSAALHHTYLYGIRSFQRTPFGGLQWRYVSIIIFISIINKYCTFAQAYGVLASWEDSTPSRPKYAPNSPKMVEDLQSKYGGVYFKKYCCVLASR